MALRKSSPLDRAARPKALLAVLIIALIGAWLYRRYIGGDDSFQDAMDDTSSFPR